MAVTGEILPAFVGEIDSGNSWSNITNALTDNDDFASITLDGVPI